MYTSFLSKKASNLVFLHGWNASWQSLYPLLERLKIKHNVYALDLPWPTSKTLTIEDYVTFTLDFIRVEKITEPILIGHSLGGAIVTKIAAEHSKVVKAIVLLAAASIRHQLPEPWLTLQKIIKPINPLIKPFRKLVLKVTNLDASDYLTLKTEIEKQTFRNLIVADLTPILSRISCPTLILWGDDDRSTLLADGKKIHATIKHSQFRSFPKTGHFFYLDYPNEVVEAINSFIKNAT